MDHSEMFLDAWELAERLAISKRSIPSLVRRGIVPAPVKLGRLRRFYWPTVASALLGNREALAAAKGAA
jgi:predicted DNA-binding transcriptional regulator AlpA